MHHGVTFSFGSSKVCSPVILETCFSYDKGIWIAATDYYMYFHIIVLFPLKSILPVNKFYSIVVFNLIDSCCHLAIGLSCFITSSLHTFSFS